MAETPTISVIIPIYNVEKWLSRAVESLRGQSFKNFELILVNDGSTDDSGALCDSFAEKDDRIWVIHRENGGAASARNEAMAQARGDYLYFMDGDDWCEPTMLEDMVTCAIQHKLDLVVTGFYIDTYYTDDEYYRELRIAPDKVYQSQRDFREHAHELFDAQLLYAPWNKLYCRSYLLEHKIEFPVTFWDDLPFNLAVIRDIEKVACLSGQFYHFLRARAESENTKYRPDMYEKREEEHFWIQELYRYWGLSNSEVEEFLARRYTERLIGCIENVTNESCGFSGREKRMQVKEMISTPQAKEALRKTEARSIMMKIMLLPLKSGNVRMTMIQSSFISFVKRRNPNIFARLKANR